MKVGIITFHRAKNLGAMLQSYALQKTIEKYVGDCEIIDYRNNDMEETYRIKTINEIKTIKGKIKNILLRKKNIEFEKIRDEFNDKIQKISNEKYNKENIRKANDIYDVVITGSDQVWNPKLNYNDNNYFLDFVTDNKKKNSYAASFGTNILESKEKEEIKKELKDFNEISVREKEGKEIVEKLTNRKADVVLDPTLLLNKKQWENIIEDKRFEKERYIFVYTIASTPTIFEFARKLAKEKNCKLICFNNSYKQHLGMKNLTRVSPQDFLNYVKNAEYIVTSSFHGLCFSINFQKQFYYELDEKKQNNNSRLTTLTQVLDLESRRIENGNCKSKESIDYNVVNELIEKERIKSIEFIKRF